MKAHARYMSYVLKHKFFVFVECCKLGIPWRGIIHDWTKLLPCEWMPYAAYFYGDESRECGGPSIRGQYRFDKAWLHHQHWNKHHWQSWLLHEDSGELKTLFIPDVYVKEMLSDWRGAGRALGFPDTAAWYVKNRKHIMLDPNARQWIEGELGVEE